jgi:16S rRNA pseudouridine516 synthase
MSSSVNRGQRLDQRLAQATGLSRSRARQLIRAGEVWVDDRRVSDPAEHVTDAASVRLGEQLLTAVTHRYLMLHKPAGVVCASRDRAHRTVLELLALVNDRDLHVAGRLDIDATGLVLITDDGDWSHRVTTPRRKLAKSYRLWLDEPITTAAIAALQQGVQLKGEGRRCAPARVELVGDAEILLTITEGRYHQVKRMLAAVGNHVRRLHREHIGALVLDPQLAPGEFRALTEAERLGIFGASP